MKHGRTAYAHSGCRCETCTGAQRAYMAAFVAALSQRPRDQVPHGTAGGYANWGCRCEQCTAANTRAAVMTRARRNVREGVPLTARQAQALAEAGGT